MTRELLLVLGLVGLLSMAGCSKNSANNQGFVSDSSTATSGETPIQANENNTFINKKGKIKDPLKVKRADKPKKKLNMNG